MLRSGEDKGIRGHQKTKIQWSNTMKPSLLSVTLLAAGALSSAWAAPINAADSGWYDQNGLHSPSIDNYFTGVLGGEELRSFFVFNLTGVAANSITSANLTVSNRDADFQGLPLPGTFGTPFTLNLFDVTSLTSDVTGGLNGAAVFSDLGTGTLLGSYAAATAAPGNVVITLNAAGLAFLNARAGGLATLGVALAAPGAVDQYIFANEGNASEFGNSTRILNIEVATTTTPGVPSSVPEPTTSTMMLGAVASLGLWTQWRRRITRR